MVCFLLIDTAPLARQLVTIIGSISGVSPTAMDIANKNAEIQFPFVTPLITNTKGTITSINLISTHETAFTPFVKLVSTDSVAIADVIEPKSVLSPTDTTIAAALPDMTLLPIKAIFVYSVILSFFSHTAASFSIGSLSPLRLDWLTNKSFASIILTSAGIISPAERYTISPTTTSSSGISI